MQAVRSEILVRLLVVSCTPVVEVLVKRPDIKYQLGFSVQNGVVSISVAVCFYAVFSLLKFDRLMAFVSSSLLC